MSAEGSRIDPSDTVAVTALKEQTPSTVGELRKILTTAHTVKAIHLTIISTLYGSVHLFRGTGTGFVKTYQSVLNVLFQPLL